MMVYNEKSKLLSSCISLQLFVHVRRIMEFLALLNCSQLALFTILICNFFNNFVKCIHTEKHSDKIVKASFVPLIKNTRSRSVKYDWVNDCFECWSKWTCFSQSTFYTMFFNAQYKQDFETVETERKISYVWHPPLQPKNAWIVQTQSIQNVPRNTILNILNTKFTSRK